MAALLVTLAIMSVLLSVAMPVWRHEAQREKEAELVFRGQQYVRAIRLYNMKTSSLPPGVDVLVQGRYLRKKFKDPITNDDFEVINAGSPQAQPGMPGQAGQPGQAGTISQPMGIASASQNVAVGGVIGVRSKSKDESIMLYQGRSHYNEWTFMYVQQQPGRGGPGGMGAPGFPGGGRGGRGGQGDGRGGRGGDGRGGFGGFGPDGRRGFGPGTQPTFPGGPGRGGRG
jgi:type II secretory pathway pseudopilin PulG